MCVCVCGCVCVCVCGGGVCGCVCVSVCVCVCVWSVTDKVHEKVTSLKLTSYGRSPVVIACTRTFTSSLLVLSLSLSLTHADTHADSRGPCRRDQAAGSGCQSKMYVTGRLKPGGTEDGRVRVCMTKFW